MKNNQENKKYVNGVKVENETKTGSQYFLSDPSNLEDNTRTYEQQKEDYLAKEKDRKARAKQEYLKIQKEDKQKQLRLQEERKAKDKIAKLEAENKKLENFQANNKYEYVQVQVDNQKNDDNKKYSCIDDYNSTRYNTNLNSPEREENDKADYEYINSKMVPKKEVHDNANEDINNNNDKQDNNAEWEKYIKHNKNNNPTFAKVLENLTTLATKGENGAKVNINGVKLSDGKLELVQSSESELDPNNEKLWQVEGFCLGLIRQMELMNS